MKNATLKRAREYMIELVEGNFPGKKQDTYFFKNASTDQNLIKFLKVLFAFMKTY